MNSKKAFLAWAAQAAISMPASYEYSLSDEAQTTLDQMLEGKRFVFLGEPDHCVTEKYSFRLTFIRHLFANGWRNIGMESGRTVGWCVDRYIETGDTANLNFDTPQVPPHLAVHYGVQDFIGRYEYSLFPQQLRLISESRPDGTEPLHYMGFDLDLSIPLGSVRPIESLLRSHTRHNSISEMLDALAGLTDLSTDQQLARVEEMRTDLAGRAESLTETLGCKTFGELQSWLSFLRDSIAAEKRPRMKEDLAAHQLWRFEREESMMQYLDEIVDKLDPDEKLILLGHNGHLSKNAGDLFNRPRQSLFWGPRSWLRALGYRIWEKTHRCPLDWRTGSVGAHLYERFPDKTSVIWMLYGQGQLAGLNGRVNVQIHDDTIESLLARVGDRFLLPLSDVDPGARAVLTNANFRWAGGTYASADLSAQADAIYFIKDITAR